MFLFRYPQILLISIAVLGAAPGASAHDYDDPPCEVLARRWQSDLAPTLKVPLADHQLDPDCESKASQFAYGVDFLKRYLPELYPLLTQAKQVVLAGPSPDESLADTEAETGLISVYDSLLAEKREYIAAQMVHEGAHLRKDDVDHVDCEQGDLKGVKAACAAEFTGELKGDAYNFSFYALKRLYELADDDPAIEQAEVLEHIRDILKNNFNHVPKPVLEEWLSE